MRLDTIFSIITAVVYLTESVGWSAPVNQPSAISHQQLANIYIPEQYGKVGEMANSDLLMANSKQVVLIKDAHCVYEAQRNIAKILDILIRDYKIDLVCVEGASGKVDTSLLGSYPDKKAREKVSDKYMRNGLFTASEVLSINKGRDPGFNIYGVEEKRLYWEDFQAFRDTIGFSDISDRFTKKIKTVIRQLKQKLYSKELLEFDGQFERYNNGGIPLTEWIRVLRRKMPAGRGGKNISLVIRSIGLERSIDFKKVEKEREGLIRELEKRLVKEDLQELVRKSILFKLGKIPMVVYYSFLEQYTNIANLRKYIRLIKLQDKIDEEELFKEIDAVKEDIYKGLITEEVGSRLYRLDKKIKILDKILHLKATREELQYCGLNRGEFALDKLLDFVKIQANINNVSIPFELNDPAFLQDIESALGSSSEFYNVALKRDEELVGNLLERMGRTKRDKAILVCGGFHYEGISRLLERKGVNLVTLTPKITKFDNESEGIYLSRMMDERITPKRILSGLGLENLTPVLAHDATVMDLLLRWPKIDIEMLCKEFGVEKEDINKLTVKELFRRDKGLLEGLKSEYKTTEDENYKGFLRLVFSECGIDVEEVSEAVGNKIPPKEASIPWIKKMLGSFTPIAEEIIFRIVPFWVACFISNIDPICGLISFVLLSTISWRFFTRFHDEKSKGLAKSITITNNIFLFLMFIRNLFSPIDTGWLVGLVILIPIIWHYYKNSGLNVRMNKWFRTIIFSFVIAMPFVLPNKVGIQKELRRPAETTPVMAPRRGVSEDLLVEKSVVPDVRTVDGRLPMYRGLEELLYNWKLRNIKAKMVGEKKKTRDWAEKETMDLARIQAMDWAEKEARHYKDKKIYNPTPSEVEDVCGKIGEVLAYSMRNMDWPDLSAEQMKIFIESLLEAESDNEHWIVRERDGKPEVKVLESYYKAYGISQIKEIAIQELGKFIYDNLRIVNNPNNPNYERAVAGLKVVYLLLFEKDYSLDSYNQLDFDMVVKFFRELPDGKGKQRKDLSSIVKKSWDLWEFNIRVSSSIIYITYDYISRNVREYKGDYPIWRMVIASYNWTYYRLVGKYKDDPYLWIVQTAELTVHTERFRRSYEQLTGRSLDNEPYWKLPPIVEQLVRGVYEDVRAGDLIREARSIINRLDWSLEKYITYLGKNPYVKKRVKGKWVIYKDEKNNLQRLEITEIRKFLGITSDSEWRFYMTNGYTLRQILINGITRVPEASNFLIDHPLHIQASSGTHKAPGPTWSDEDNAIFEEQCRKLLRNIPEVTDPDVRAKINKATQLANQMAGAGIDNTDNVVLHIVPSDKLGIPRYEGAESAKDMVYAVGRDGYYENGNLVKDGRLHIYVTRKYWDEHLYINELQLAETLDHEWQENVLGKTHRQAAERVRLFVKDGEMLSEYHRFVVGQLLDSGEEGLRHLDGILKEERTVPDDELVGQYEEDFREYVRGNTALKVLGVDFIEEVVDEVYEILLRREIRIERKDVWDAVVSAMKEEGTPSLERIMELINKIPGLDVRDIFILAKEITIPLGILISVEEKAQGGEFIAKVLERILEKIKEANKDLEMSKEEDLRKRFFDIVERVLVERFGVEEAELAGELELIDMGLFLLEFEPLLNLTKVDKGYFDYFTMVCEMTGVSPSVLRDLFCDMYDEYQEKVIWEKLEEEGINVDDLMKERGEVEKTLKKKGLWEKYERIERIIEIMNEDFLDADVVKKEDSAFGKAARRLRLYKWIVGKGLKGQINISGISEDLVGLNEVVDFKDVIVDEPKQLNGYLSGTAVAQEGIDYLVKQLGIDTSREGMVSIYEELFMESFVVEKDRTRITYSPGIVALLKKVPGLKVEIRAKSGDSKRELEEIRTALIKNHPEFRDRIRIVDEFKNKDDVKLERKDTIYILSNEQVDLGRALGEDIKGNRVKLFCTNIMALHSAVLFGLELVSIDGMFEEGKYTDSAKEVLRKLEVFYTDKEIIEKIISENEPLIIITTAQILRQYQLYRATIEISA